LVALVFFLPLPLCLIPSFHIPAPHSPQNYPLLIYPLPPLPPPPPQQFKVSTMSLTLNFMEFIVFWRLIMLGFFFYDARVWLNLDQYLVINYVN